jgi:hypothetical protein
MAREARHSVAVTLHLSKPRHRQAPQDTDAALNQASLHERAPPITSASYGSVLRVPSSARVAPWDDEPPPIDYSDTPPPETDTRNAHLGTQQPEARNQGPQWGHSSPPLHPQGGSRSSSPAGSSSFEEIPLHTEELATPAAQPSSSQRSRMPASLPQRQSARVSPSPWTGSRIGADAERNKRLVYYSKSPTGSLSRLEAGNLGHPHERASMRSRRQLLLDAVTRTAHGTVDAASQVARKARLPEAKEAVAHSSIVRAIGTTVNTLMAPVRLAGQTTSTLVQAGNSWWNKPRQSSEALQHALQGDGVDLSDRHHQGLAHAHAVDYGKCAATVLDTALPGLHKVLGVGVAGTVLTFGAGRNAGHVAGDALGRLERGAPPAGGGLAGPEPPAQALSSGTVVQFAGTGVQQWLLGSATGAVGNMTGQYLVAPLVNLISRQFQAIDPRAVLPDETVDLMNRLQPKSGDALREQVRHAQRDVASIDSPGNVRLGQFAFDTFTAARFAAYSGLRLGAGGQMAAGLAVSTTAGMLMGAVMATRQSTAKLEVPDIEALRLAVAAHEAQPGSDGAAALAAVATHPVPLFFPRKMAPAAPARPRGDIETGDGEPPAATNADAAQRGRLAHMADTARWAVQQAARPLVTVGQVWGQSLRASPLLEPAAPGTDGAITAGRVAATASNVGASLWNRGTEMAKATMTTSLMGTLSAILASTTEGPARRIILALGNGVGIHAAVKPWFDALASNIPQGDQAIREHRLGLANTQAAP